MLIVLLPSIFCRFSVDGCGFLHFYILATCVFYLVKFYCFMFHLTISFTFICEY